MFAYVFNNMKESKASDYLCRLKRNSSEVKAINKRVLIRPISTHRALGRINHNTIFRYIYFHYLIKQLIKNSFSNT